MKTLLLAILIASNALFNAVYAQDQSANFTPVTPSQDDFVGNIAITALSQIGTPYKYGGNTPETGFDCSGFIKYVYDKNIDISLPRRARDMSQLGQTVKLIDIQPGDLLFFNTRGRKFSHVGIYIGEQRFVHAPSTGGEVRIEDMDSNYWVKRFNGARRLTAYALP